MTTCQQETCSEPATARFYWPGAGWRLACAEHAAKAVSIGRAMHWLITVEAWPKPTEPKADE